MCVTPVAKDFRECMHEFEQGDGAGLWSSIEPRMEQASGAPSNKALRSVLRMSPGTPDDVPAREMATRPSHKPGKVAIVYRHIGKYNVFQHSDWRPAHVRACVRVRVRVCVCVCACVCVCVCVFSLFAYMQPPPPQLKNLPALPCVLGWFNASSTIVAGCVFLV